MQESKFKNTGTSQQKRMFEALKADYVNIDEKSFEDLLVFTSRLSKLINFYNENNQIDGDWSHFFSDETVILATIIDSEPTEIEKRFKSYIKKISLFKQPAKKNKYILKCFEEVYAIATKFEHWYSRLREIEEFTRFQLSVRSEISNAISSKLAIALKKLHKLYETKLEYYGVASNQLLTFTEFSSIWEVQEPLIDEAFEVTEAESDNAEDFLLKELEKIFQSFYETLLYLKSKTPEYLKQSMESDIHYPEIALFLAFLKLYEHAKDNINQLTSKHIEFYFKDILRQVPKEKKLDKIYLQFLLNDEALFTKIDEGTQFIGEDPASNEDIIYETTEGILINKAQVKQIFSVFIDKELLNVEGKAVKKINNILEAKLPIDQLLPKQKKENELLAKSYAAFGESQNKKGISEKTMSSAKLGFALSSPNLFLKSGFREVEIVIQLNTKSFEDLNNDLNAICKTTGDKFDELFIKAFTNSFNLSITSEKGWLKISKYVVKRDETQNTLTFAFDLLNSDPAIISHTATLHEGNFDSALPIVKFELNSDSFIYPYTLLSRIVINQVWFHVNVSNMKELKLYNNIGQLSPDSPFLPFGPQPKAGAYFIIGNNEVFNKPLEDLKINIEWFDLPVHKGGFEEHYASYGLSIDNTSFEVAISVLEDGRWMPAAKNEQQKLKLFRTEEKGMHKDPSAKGKLIDTSIFSTIDIKKIKQSANYEEITEEQELNSTSRRSFVKLELNNPPNGFGHDVYPSILSETVMENARGGLLKNKEKSKKSIPNQPYTPQIKTISLDYSASSAVSLIENSKTSSAYSGELFHLHPFGLKKIQSKGGSQNTYLLPDYHFEGAMYLGFADLAPPQQLSILFEMIDEYTESSEEDLPVIEWSYLVNDEWLTLAPSRILRDETNRFLRTGMIVIDIPADIKKHNTILPADLYWLRISVEKNIETASSLISVATNVTQAMLVDNNLPQGYLEKPLPAFVIQRSINNIPGIREVRQPLPSFSGRAKESAEKFYTRVGERLHHKNRAVTAWDYERILLEKFPEIAHVTCLSNMTSKSTDAPGNVLIVVSPQAKYSASANEPMASSELLFKIKSYIGSFSSPFVKIEVRNPNYERIKIICAVKFTDGYNYGFYIQKLNEQINQYLRGTLLTQSKKVELGGSIHSSDILSYMRTLPYVNFITKFSMVQVSRDLDGYYQLIDTAREGGKSSSLVATKPWSVLVPAPEHQISVLIEKSEERSRQAGIDYLELGHDFIIEE
ncbi:hypothetical protein GCM10011506_35710 [Marivirga lumbricoides]|uniref:Baseplate protein J-like domain-containing protein n=1 Tax=Marivirga lumbricoides TaxID=1046115 RepID=A0ABQ1MUA1_9BACT|nr:hypothetical protein GCM10011506_35710 [Marivirga lumbricoides]